jgi:hypothetical protein
MVPGDIAGRISAVRNTSPAAGNSELIARLALFIGLDISA